MKETITHNKHSEKWVPNSYEEVTAWRKRLHNNKYKNVRKIIAPITAWRFKLGYYTHKILFILYYFSINIFRFVFFTPHRMVEYILKNESRIWWIVLWPIACFCWTIFLMLILNVIVVNLKSIVHSLYGSSFGL